MIRAGNVINATVVYFLLLTVSVEAASCTRKYMQTCKNCTNCKISSCTNHFDTVTADLHQCKTACSENSTCLMASHDVNETCKLYETYTEVQLDYSMTYAVMRRGCTPAAECERRYIQTCTKCKIASCAKLYSTTTADLYHCETSCLANSGCQVAVHDQSNNCKLYTACATVNFDYLGTNTVIRRSCVSDCPLLTLKRSNNKRGIQNRLFKTIRNSKNEGECLTECLDTARCKGLTYNTKTCYLYDSSSPEQGDAYYFIPLTCSDCGSAPTLSHGSATLSASGATVSYSCAVGYILSGSETTECQPNGAWSGSTPTCKIEDCGSLTPPIHGSVHVSVAGVTTYGATAVYSCDVGYTLTGQGTIECQASGLWSGTAICEIFEKVTTTLSLPTTSTSSTSTKTVKITATPTSTTPGKSILLSSTSPVQTTFIAGQATTTAGTTAPPISLTEDSIRFMRTSDSVVATIPSENASGTRLTNITTPEATYSSTLILETASQTFLAPEAGTQTIMSPESSSFTSSKAVMFELSLMVTNKSRQTNSSKSLTTTNKRKFSSTLVTMIPQSLPTSVATQKMSAHKPKHKMKLKCSSTRATHELLLTYLMLYLQWTY